jgi:excisionase family DNA binding protein
MADYQQRSLNGFELTKEWYSTREVAELFGVTVSTVHAWIKAGCINGVMMAPKTNKAKTDRGRYRIYSDGLHDLELKRDTLIRESMRYWPRIMKKLGK